MNKQYLKAETQMTYTYMKIDYLSVVIIGI